MCVTAYISIAKPTLSLRAPTRRYVMWKWQKGRFFSWVSVACKLSFHQLSIYLSSLLRYMMGLTGQHINTSPVESWNFASTQHLAVFYSCSMEGSYYFELYLLRVHLLSAFNLVKCCSYFIRYYQLLQNNTKIPRLSTTDMWNLHLPDF